MQFSNFVSTVSNSKASSSSHPQRHPPLLCRLQPLPNLNFQNDYHSIYALVLHTSNTYSAQLCIRIILLSWWLLRSRRLLPQQLLRWLLCLATISPCFLLVFNPNSSMMIHIRHAKQLESLKTRTRQKSLSSPYKVSILFVWSLLPFCFLSSGGQGVQCNRG